MTLALAGVEVDLGIRTGLQSRVLVLETHRGERPEGAGSGWQKLRLYQVLQAG
jgi:hypothetical protein